MNILPAAALILLVSACASHPSAMRSVCPAPRDFTVLRPDSSSTLLRWPTVVRWRDQFVVAGTVQQVGGAGDGQTSILSFGSSGAPNLLDRVDEKALQLAVDPDGTLHVFGVTGYDPGGNSAARMELWHRSHNGRTWTAREMLLRASLINWPVSMRAVAAAPDKSLHAVVSYADSAGAAGVFYARKESGSAWVKAVVFERAAALATLSAVSADRVVVAFFRGDSRVGDVSNIHVTTIDRSMNVTPPVLAYRSGRMPVVAAAVQTLQGDSLRLVFGQRAEDMSNLAIARVTSADNGRTWRAAQPEAAINSPFRTVIGMNPCGEPVTVAHQGNDRGMPLLSIAHRGTIHRLELDQATVIDFGAYLEPSGTLLLVTSEVLGGRPGWRLRISHD